MRVDMCVNGRTVKAQFSSTKTPCYLLYIIQSIEEQKLSKYRPGEAADKQINNYYIC